MTRHPPSVQSAATMLIGAPLIELAHVEYAFEELAVPLPLLAVARRAKLFHLPIVGRHTSLDTQRPGHALLMRARIIPSDTPPHVGKRPKVAQKPMEKHQPVMVVSWW